MKYARVAGFAYLAIIISSILNQIFIYNKLMVDGDAAATASNIMANELLFRSALAIDLVMFAAVVLLSFTLYVILKTVDKNLALLALLWRMAEAVLGGVTVLLGLLAALLLNGKDTLTIFEPEQVQALVDLFLRARANGIDVAIFFVCLGTIVFGYLLYKSRFVPRILAAFGIASFVLMLVGSLSNILFPQYAEWAEMGYGPGALFEIVIGLWLLVKGVNVEYWENRQLRQQS